MWSIIKTILGYVVNLIKGVVGGAVIDQKIAEDTHAIDAKSADSKAELARLNDLGVLKTTASNEAQVLTDKVTTDDVKVADAKTMTDKATAALNATKATQPTGVTTSALEKQLDDLDR